MSQPFGVRKFVAPRSVTPPAGVPRSSGTMSARTSAIAVSSGTGCFSFMNVIFWFTMPMLPIGSCSSMEKIVTPWASGVLRK